jgi:hypothetical protein
MGDGGERHPRWSDREVGLILRRAVELQQEEQRHPPGAPGSADGASLEDLEEMAREVGVEPALVRRAAAEMEARPRPTPVSRWMGGPRRIVFERALRGEAPQAAIEALVGVVQEVLGEHGQPGMVGRTFTWTSLTASGRHGPRGRQITISVAPRDGVTTVRIEEGLRPAAGGLFGGLLGGVGGGSSGMAVGIGVGALNSPLAAVAIWLCAFGSAYAGALALYRRTVRRRTEDLQGLLARITEHLQSALAGAALAAPAAARALPPADKG